MEGEKDHSAYMSPALLDAQLTPLGWSQVKSLVSFLLVNYHVLSDLITKVHIMLWTTKVVLLSNI